MSAQLFPFVESIDSIAVMNRRILGHLTKNNLLSDSQYGFRSARSTADALTVFTHRVSQALHDNFHARAVA